MSSVCKARLRSALTSFANSQPSAAERKSFSGVRNARSKSVVLRGWRHSKDSHKTLDIKCRRRIACTAARDSHTLSRTQISGKEKTLNLTTLKTRLEFVTNIAVVLLILVGVGVAARQYFRSKERPLNKARIQAGSAFPTIPEVHYNQSPKTLLVALNVYCKFCVESVPFYELSAAQRENESSFQLATLFLNKEAYLVSDFINEKGLSATAVPAVDSSSLWIDTTPTLVLVDNNGKVLNSWVHGSGGGGWWLQ